MINLNKYIKNMNPKALYRIHILSKIFLLSIMILSQIWIAKIILEYGRFGIHLLFAFFYFAHASLIKYKIISNFSMNVKNQLFKVFNLYMFFDIFYNFTLGLSVCFFMMTPSLKWFFKISAFMVCIYFCFWACTYSIKKNIILKFKNYIARKRK